MPLVPILAVALLGPPAADPVAGSPASLPSHQVFTWTWTDGSKATERTFAESKYHTPDKIPKFEVTVRPAEPRWTARLLFWVNGEWVPRQTKKSDTRGRMRCAFLPIGPDGQWEDVTWIVRIRLRVEPTRGVSVLAPRTKVRELLLTIHYVSRISR